MTGPELRTLRLCHGLTQDALATLLGYDQRTISHMERGYCRVNPRVIVLLKKILPPLKKPLDSDTQNEYTLDS